VSGSGCRKCGRSAPNGLNSPKFPLVVPPGGFLANVPLWCRPWSGCFEPGSVGRARVAGAHERWAKSAIRADCLSTIIVGEGGIEKLGRGESKWVPTTQQHSKQKVKTSCRESDKTNFGYKLGVVNNLASNSYFSPINWRVFLILYHDNHFLWLIVKMASTTAE
jgi:hypothetical protein